jgi:hypothetical protein
VIAGRRLAGVIGGDDVAYVGGTASFANKNAGVGKTVTASGLSLTGTDANNYTVNGTASASADIARASLGVNGITALDKLYDGTTVAVVNTSNVAFTGLRAGDEVTVTATGQFADATPATDKTVLISNIALSGPDGGNYELLATTAAATADIDGRAIIAPPLTPTQVGGAQPGQSGTAADPLQSEPDALIEIDSPAPDEEEVES